MFVYVSSNWSEKPTTSKSRPRASALERDERHLVLAEERLHVDPRRVRAFAERARIVAQDPLQEILKPRWLMPMS